YPRSLAGALRPCRRPGRARRRRDLGPRGVVFYPTPSRPTASQGSCEVSRRSRREGGSVAGISVTARCKGWGTRAADGSFRPSGGIGRNTFLRFEPSLEPDLEAAERSVASTFF